MIGAWTCRWDLGAGVGASAGASWVQQRVKGPVVARWWCVNRGWSANVQVTFVHPGAVCTAAWRGRSKGVRAAGRSGCRGPGAGRGGRGVFTGWNGGADQFGSSVNWLVGRAQRRYRRSSGGDRRAYQRRGHRLAERRDRPVGGSVPGPHVPARRGDRWTSSGAFETWRPCNWAKARKDDLVGGCLLRAGVQRVGRPGR